MPLRELILDTFSSRAAPDELAPRWGALTYRSRTFRRLMAVEYCAPELLTRLHALGLAAALRPEHAAELKHGARMDVARMLGIRLELEALLGELRSRRIAVTLLKGAAFLECGLRPQRTCVDLDLLVAERDLPSAVRALLALGYSERAELAGVKSLPSYDRPGSAPVELHYRPLFRLGSPPDEQWATTPIGDGVSVLAPTDWCWHALAHEAYHSDTSGRTRGALDIVSLDERFGRAIDWRVIEERAARWPDRVEPVAYSLARLGRSVPLAVPRRARWSIAWSSIAREYAARVAARDDLFVFAVQKLGGLAFAAPAMWAENRRGAREQPAATIPSMLRDAARLAKVMLGLDAA